MKTKTFPYYRRSCLKFHSSAIQVVNLLIAGGLGFLLIGYLINYDDYGLTLNFAHQLLLTLTMVALIVFGLRKNTKSVFWLNVILGVFYLLSFFLGVLFGFPVLVNSYLFNADEMFVVADPRILDLGLLDFYFHGLMGFAYAICAVFWHMLYRMPESPNSGNPN
jgi:hypothetical protein